MSTGRGSLGLLSLGRVEYGRALELQRELWRLRVEDAIPDTLVLLEHEPVITLGRSAKASNLLVSEAELARRGVALYRIERGGDVTFHGPGQLVGYPVFQLRRGLVHHVETLAAALVAVCAELGISAQWRSDPAGVWVGRDKVAAFGLHVHQGVAIHGFALNVTTPLEAFGAIVPCGLRAAGVTSLAELTGGRCPTPENLAPRVAAAVGLAFHRPGAPSRAEELWSLLSRSTPIQ